MAQDNNQMIGENLEESATIRRYLLGELSESEQEKIEERILLDNDYFLQLQLIEEDLIDLYIQDALSADEREKFHQRFLSTPERIRSVKFARTLGEYVKDKHKTDSPPESGEPLEQPFLKRSFIASLQAPHPALRWSIVALLLIVVGLSWVLIKVLRKPDYAEPSQAQKTIPQAEQPSQNVPSSTGNEIRNPQPAPSPNELASANQQKPDGSSNSPRITAPETPQSKGIAYSIVLSPGLTRDDNGATLLEVPREASSVGFRLLLATTSYSKYRATLFRGQQEIRSWSMAKAINGRSGNYVIVTAPVKFLSNGSYYILLNGVAPNGDLQEIDRYYFRISKE